jgi:hypothetical protein
MSSTDTMTAEFPHGTKDGFQQGCKTNPMCSNDGITAQTCKDAATHYRSDFRYKKLVDGGMPEHHAWQQLFAEDSAPVVAPKPKPRARSKEFDEPIEEITDAAPEVPKPARKIAAHGTTSGYSAGCRDNCPGDENGVTCRQAVAAYQREKKAERAEALRIVRRETNPEPIQETVAQEAAAAVESEAADAPQGQTLVLPTIVDEANIFGDDFPETSAAVKTASGIDEAVAEAKQERDAAQADALDEAQQTNLQLRLELDVRTSERDDARAALASVAAPALEQSHLPDLAVLVEPTPDGGVRLQLFGVTGTVDLSMSFAEHGIDYIAINPSAAA